MEIPDIVKTVKYIEIAEELKQEIISGKYKAGDKLYSRSQLAAKYHIGEVTAVRVQNYLAQGGFVRKVPGGGIFVNYASDSLAMRLERNHWPKVRKIVEFRLNSSVRSESFPKRFYAEIEKQIRDRNIPYQLRLFTSSEVSENALNLFQNEADAGYLILFQGAMTTFYTGTLLLNPNIHNVVLDTIIPGANCVLTDSFDGMRQLVDCAVERGCKSFVFAKNFEKSLGDLYNEERTDAALYHCRRHGYGCLVLDSGSYDELVEHLASVREKTAVMFPQDEPACRLKKLLDKSHLKKLLITGFDNFSEFEKMEPDIPTIAIDYKKIVETALDILCGEHNFRKRIIRVPGRLVC